MKMRTLLAVLALLALSLAGSAMAETHTIMQDGVSWEPSEITIQVGDTVEWMWTSLSHTVTNGNGPDDPDAGSMFDETLDSANPLVSYTFTEAGAVPFFCRPHFALGMTGVITVEDGVATESTTWSAVHALFR